MIADLTPTVTLTVTADHTPYNDTNDNFPEGVTEILEPPSPTNIAAPNDLSEGMEGR